MEIIRISSANEELIVDCGKILSECFQCYSPEDKGAVEVRKYLDMDSSIVLAALEDGKAVGIIGAHREYAPYGWELHPLAVTKSARRKGVATQLVKKMEQLAQECGALVIYLGTDDETSSTSLSNCDLFEDTFVKIENIKNYNGHAYEFYQTCGYKIVGVLPDVNGLGKPDIFMAKRIN